MTEFSAKDRLAGTLSSEGGFIQHTIGVDALGGDVNGAQSEGNSTTELLGSGGTFTGTGELSSAPDVMASCYSDTSGTLYFDFSTDGTNWDSTFPPTGFDVTGGINEFHIGVKGPRYFRARFVNGSTAQTEFRLGVYYGKFKIFDRNTMNEAAALDPVMIKAKDLGDGTYAYAHSDETAQTKIEALTSVVTLLKGLVQSLVDLIDGGGLKVKII